MISELVIEFKNLVTEAIVVTDKADAVTIGVYVVRGYCQCA